MLYRKLQASQVKCNFCLNWITLSSDIKFHINICDHCLQQGTKVNNLKAVASSGEFYSISLDKQKSLTEIRDQQNILYPIMNQNETLVDTNRLQNNLDILPVNDKENNIENKQVLQIQDMLSQFLKQKQTLSKQQVYFLKSIIIKKPVNLSQRVINFQSQIVCHKIQNQRIPLQFQILSQQKFIDSQQTFIRSQQKISLKDQSNILHSLKDNKFHSININLITNKQNQPLKTKTHQRNKQNISLSKQKQRNVFNSPNKNSLKQRDLNCFYNRLDKSPRQKQHQTPKKRFNTSFFYDNNENQRLISSRLQNSFQSLENLTSFSLRKSNCKNILEKFSYSEIKKIEETKNKISNYLQKNCESNSFGRLMFNAVYEAFQNTNIVGKTMELVSYSLIDTDFRCYLKSFDWQGIQVLKLVKTNLTDENLKILIDFIQQNKLGIKVLVLTSNMLSQVSIEYLNEKDLSCVREIYLGKNRINKVKVKDIIRDLGCKYSLFL